MSYLNFGLEIVIVIKIILCSCFSQRSVWLLYCYDIESKDIVYENLKGIVTSFVLRIRFFINMLKNKWREKEE